jgi:hypothetical protein
VKRRAGRLANREGGGPRYGRHVSVGLGDRRVQVSMDVRAEGALEALQVAWGCGAAPAIKMALVKVAQREVPGPLESHTEAALKRRHALDDEALMKRYGVGFGKGGGK